MSGEDVPLVDRIADAIPMSLVLGESRPNALVIAAHIAAALGLEEIGYTYSPDVVAVHHDAPRLDDDQPVYRLTGGLHHE